MSTDHGDNLGVVIGVKANATMKLPEARKLWTVEELKKAILDHSILMWQGKRLQDDKCLMDYGFENHEENEVWLVFKSGARYATADDEGKVTITKGA